MSGIRREVRAQKQKVVACIQLHRTKGGEKSTDKVRK